MVVGSGGREHALVWKLKKDNQSAQLFSVPGNGGISDIAKCIPLYTEQPGADSGYSDRK
jgi:phosphoribosylamine--glycine ligase